MQKPPANRISIRRPASKVIKAKKDLYNSRSRFRITLPNLSSRRLPKVDDPLIASYLIISSEPNVSSDYLED